MKSDNQEHVGKHAFEVAGLGLAPFRFFSLATNKISYPDGSCQAGGTCDYCGTGIMYECVIQSADGKRSKVGTDCIRKVGDEGMILAFKRSPEFRRHTRELAQAKDARKRAELDALIEANKEALAALPHPYGFTDRETGKPLTYLDQVRWNVSRCGAAGRASWLRTLKAKLNAAPAASTPASGSVRTCEMERISRPGKCGQAISGYWLHDDGTKTAVCDMCAPSVMVNGGKLEEAPNPV